MMLILEIHGSWHWHPGYVRASIAGQPFHRCWWGWFALAWTRLSLPEYQLACRTGQVEWRLH
jgi:hypothetical protein